MKRRFVFVSFVRALLWGCALAVALAPHLSFTGIWGAFVGSILGTFTWLRINYSVGSSGRQRTGGLVIASVIIGGFFFLGPSCWSWLGVSFSKSVWISEFLKAAVISASAILLFSAWSSKMRIAKLVESLLCVCLVSSTFFAHRHGQVQRPYWLTDYLAQQGISSLDGTWMVGVGAALLSVMLLCIPVSSERSNSFSRVMVRAVILLIIFAGSVVATRWMPSPTLTPPAYLPPPKAPDAPPPPPQPSNVALVVFSEWFKLSAHLDSYYFRSDPVEHQPELEPHPAQDGEATKPARQAMVHMLIQTHEKPALVNSVRITGANARPPFTASFETSSMLPEKDPAEQYEQELAFEDKRWLPREKAEYLRTEVSFATQQLVKEILVSEPAIPAMKLSALKSWLEANFVLSEKAAKASAKISLEDIFHKKQPGGRGELSRGMVTMLRLAGIPARIGTGYRYAKGTTFQQNILLTDLHRQTWPEVFVANSGWTPIALQPAKVLDEPVPPPQSDLENILAKLQEQPKGSFEPPSAAKTARSVTAMVLIVALKILIGLVILHPLALQAFRRYHWFYFRHALVMLRLSGMQRQFGESWDEFKSRLSSLSKMAGRKFNSMLASQMDQGATIRSSAASRLELLGASYILLGLLPWIVLRRQFHNPVIASSPLIRPDTTNISTLKQS